MGIQIIAHLDMDSFYASVEMRDDPSLIGKPVVVGSDPQGGKGRGVVSTCSYEARKYGLTSGMPISQAWMLCPQAVYIRPSGKYLVTSARIMETIHDLVPEIEQVSIDEAYLNLSFCQTWEAAGELAARIKEEIVRKEHLSCSIGIGPARSYAKMASDLEKPDGLVVISPETLHAVIDSLPASRIPGIGKKSNAALRSLGIHTIKDLAETNIQRLQDLFGKHAVRVQAIASGRDENGLREQGPCRSVGRETTFPVDTTDIGVISGTFQELASILASEMKRKKARCRTVGIRIRYTGFVTRTRSITRTHSLDDAGDILRIVSALFDENWTGEPVRLIGIRLSGLSFRDLVQSELDQFMLL
jgi:DNA polymerase IV (DinB-like DNA polymerase)